MTFTFDPEAAAVAWLLACFFTWCLATLLLEEPRR